MLKAEGTYTGSLDGLYGPGTAKGYNQTLSANPDVKKYQILTKYAPAENADAQQKNASGYNINWEAIELLETIVNDLNPSPEKANATKAVEKKLKQTQLLSMTNAPNATEYANIDSWNESLWNGITNWEKTDPLHKRLATPLKIAYFQSWALLEDYFMDKGFEAKDARGMALFVLQNIVEPALSSYKK